MLSLILGWLHRVDVCNVADVSEVHCLSAHFDLKDGDSIYVVPCFYEL
jgi:hypothetical protein